MAHIRRHISQALTVVIPNNKARHRAKASGFVLKYELAYLRNRWYVELKPRIKRFINKNK